MHTSKILVTGANGQLGKSIKDAASSFPQFEFVFLSRLDLQVEQAEAVEAVFKSVSPQFCINCAAYTAVDKAESEKDKALLVNAEAVKILARICNKYQVKFLHISTDYVFNGLSSVPYKESDAIDPINMYGVSKAKGEQWAVEYNPESIIVRTSWLYSEHGNNFVKTMLRLMKEREALDIVNDQVGCPTYCFDLAQAILTIIASKAWQPGIYHYSGKGRISWYDFAVAIKELTASNCRLHPILSEAYPLPAKRPAFSLLDTSKISKAYMLDIPFWENSLANCIQKML
ncbi:MAG TPA: dTDP-4-dehydrorhamnose reductase [Agriterribacter sp.]|nr:dTDP-4-dehydrorhamnose reductase [Agriterribacter sp.]